jgi:hypothetical protein
MTYSYQHFLDEANRAGLLSQFSRYDLDTAQRNPDFGLSILGLKKDYATATPEQRLLINEQANRLRSSYGNYTGGATGSSFISDGKLPTQIDATLDTMSSFPKFDYAAQKPEYSNPYAAQQDAILQAILNRPDFSYSTENDPLYSSYRKQYLREGNRATQDALAAASAASGGIPSSFAVNAATQAGDYYNAQLTDIIPQLEQQAYGRYQDEHNRDLSNLDAVNGQEQLAYQKYLNDLGQFNTDRGFAYNTYTDEYNRLLSNLSAMQGQDATDYSRMMDQTALRTDESRYQDTLRLQQQQMQEAAKQQIIDNAWREVQALGSVSQNAANALGIPAGTLTADQIYANWQMQNAKSGGGSGGSSSTAKQSAVQGLLGRLLNGDTGTDVLTGLLSYGYSMDDIYDLLDARGELAGSSGANTSSTMTAARSLDSRSSQDSAPGGKYSTQTSGGTPDGTVQLSVAGQQMANLLSRTRYPVSTVAERVESAYNSGKITEADARYLMQMVGKS